jgi:hypothetical protein
VSWQQRQQQQQRSPLAKARLAAMLPAALAVAALES